MNDISVMSDDELCNELASLELAKEMSQDDDRRRNELLAEYVIRKSKNHERREAQKHADAVLLKKNALLKELKEPTK